MTDERVLILMPTAKDGLLAARALSSAGLDARLCRDAAELCREVTAGVGVLLASECHLLGEAGRCITPLLRAQPAWSSIPVVALCHGGESLREAVLAIAAGVTFVERPVRMRTLLSVVRSALRARRNQYEARDAIAALSASEARLRFLDAIGQATRGEADPVGIMAVTAKLLGEHLRVSRCVYADVGPDGDTFSIPHDWTDGVASIVGAYRLAWFGPRASELLLAGRTLVIRDLEAEFATDAGVAAFRAIEIRAAVGCPLVKDGRLVAIMAVHQSTPRDWTASEIGLVEQVVERSWAHIERASAETRLREADRRKDEFLATLAHELRNPLAPVRSGLEILRRSASPDEAREVREMMARQLGHVVRLVDDLMDVARVSSGKITLRRERVELAAVVRSAVEVSRDAIEAAGHRLTIRLPDEPIAFDGDRTRLEQILANLLTNAAKYTNPGGRIDVTARLDGDKGVIRVEDNGVGIPAAMLPKVFDLFTQIDRSLEKSQGGLGIGLTLVRKLVELHHGTVSAASDGPGRGSAFEVHLPLATGAVPDAPRDEAPAGGGARRVLVVDDNTDAAKSLAVLLRLDGHEVRTAHDGPSAIEVADAFRPEVVFLDIGLPGMNGYEVAVRLRQRPALGRFTLIALTGWGGADDRRRSDEAGFDHHLVKPLDPDILADLFASVG